MQNLNSPLSPEIWLNDLFASKAVQQGGVIRRKARDVERFVGMELFLREIHRRGFQVAENSGQIVIFCNRALVRWLSGPVPLS
ncbi:aspartate aminotransferase [Roseovarius sp. PS-C2]|uniref:aspartate aminotransferase n=1 Tax=Roseovarius sp. PS-C2 TaxID=2820814 RepID=UPI001C0B6603|nr:aspartate aminotransferase [Roseovarius sp. PS-C2]MBU3258589.1 aspartate aminotransferase [Roseovarius sp. PS-C2]